MYTFMSGLESLGWCFVMAFCLQLMNYGPCSHLSNAISNPFWSPVSMCICKSTGTVQLHSCSPWHTAWFQALSTCLPLRNAFVWTPKYLFLCQVILLNWNASTVQKNSPDNLFVFEVITTIIYFLFTPLFTLFNQLDCKYCTYFYQ